LAIAEAHVRLLPIRTLADEPPLALRLAMRLRRAHLGDLRSEQLLDRLLDLDLGGIDRHLEDQRLAILLAQDRRLFRDDRALDDVGQFHERASCRRSSAARVAITRVASITSRAEIRLAGRNRTPSMLRVDRCRFSSRCRSTSSVLPLAPSAFSIE